MKTIIVEGNKGFLFKKGKFIKMVEAGEYKGCLQAWQARHIAR